MIFTVIVVLIMLSLFLRRKPEDYEGAVGPSPVSEVAKEKQMSQAELDAVLKFIR